MSIRLRGECVRCQRLSSDLSIPCECGMPMQACRHHGLPIIFARWAGTWWKPWTWCLMTYVYEPCPRCNPRRAKA